MNNLQKVKPWRNAKYRKWVKSLNCVVTGAPADVAHHATNTGKRGMGTKTDDYYCFPLTQEQHQLLHQDPVKWEGLHGLQLNHAARTRELAAAEGWDWCKIWGDGLC